MPRRELRVKEEANRLFVAAMLRGDEAEDAESQHLRQHLHLSPRRPKYKHQYHRAMSQLRLRLRLRSPTASRLYGPPHHSMADNL